MASLTSLAEEALAQAKKLDAYCLSEGRSLTSFDSDTLNDLPPDLSAARDALIDSSHTLKQLALRPLGLLAEIARLSIPVLSLSAVNAYNLADHVPLEGSTTLLEIADRSGLSVQLVERFMRHAMGSHIFTEENGMIRHTASSRLLATLPDLKAAISMRFTEACPALMKVPDAINAYPNCDEPSESGYSLAHEPGVTMFAHMAKHPERMENFSKAMGFYGKNDAFDVKHLVTGYPWSDLDHPGTVLVDVGGGHGSVSKALASATKHIHFIVQDQQISTSDSSALSDGLEGRIEFMKHDFFTEQPIKSAQIYFFRWILHDWSDKYAVRILKNLIPAMRDGTRVVLFETILKDGPETKWTEMQARFAFHSPLPPPNS
ncbi:MAG: hypothetical protein Q9195_008627 [Heterodermia aff. obscurata]